jgi:hypothetical protein
MNVLVAAEQLPSSPPARSLEQIPGADVAMRLVLDRPDPGPDFEAWQQAKQAGPLAVRLRVRRHSSNLGASAARNRLLQESCAELCVFAGDGSLRAAGA